MDSTRAVLIDELGPPEKLLDRRIPLPDPGPGAIHVRVEAAGVNFADLAMRMGMYSTVPPRPFAPGFEVAGTVQRLGPGESLLREGDRVVGLLRHGGYAEDVLLDARNAFPIPDEMDWIRAAAIPVAFLTAWTCLFGVGRAEEGETVLVLGAAGGVGTAAVQLACAAGLRVFGTAGTAIKRAFVVRELGAVECFDARADWSRPLRARIGERGLDIALDPVGGRASQRCRALLGPLGRHVFYGLSEALPGTRRNWAQAAWSWLKTPLLHPLSLVEPNLSVCGVHLLHLGRKEALLRRAFEEMLPRLLSGELQPIVDRTFPLNATGAAAAHQRLHARQNLGKVVLRRID
jgi:NADPH2:quinone reductase